MSPAVNSTTRDLREVGRILMVLAHPNIEEVRSASRVRLETIPVAGSTLNSADLTTTELRALFVKIASTLAHVHAAHHTHGSLSPQSIVVRADGSPVLRNFMQCRIRDTSALEFGIEVATLGTLLLSKLDPPTVRLRASIGDESTALASSMRSIAGQAVAGRLTASQFATRLHRCAAEPARKRPPLRVAAVAVAALALAIGTVGATNAAGDQPDSSAPALLPSAPTTSVVATLADGDRFVTGATEGDQLVTGEFGCGPTRAVLLRASDATLWVFDSLPRPGSSATSRQLSAEVVPQAVRVEVVAGCDTLIAATAAGDSPVEVAKT